MQIIAIILKDILNKKFTSLLIVIQLVITIIVLVQAYCNIKALNYPEMQLKEIKLDTKNIYHIKFMNSALSKDFQESFNEFNKSLTENLETENIGSFDKTNTQFEELEKNKNFLTLRRSLTKGTFKEMHPESIELYRVDYAIYNLMNVNITEGRTLSESDFIIDKNDPIPMVVSNTYKGVMHLNDVLSSRLDDKKYIIVGFFETNLKWLDDTDYISKLLVPFNDKIITPYIEDNSPISSMIKSQAEFYIHRNNSSIEIQNIVEEAKKFNLSVKLYSLTSELEEIKGKNKETIFYGIFISVFVTILSCFGLSAIMYYSVNSRKREFGIRIMSGASIKYIKTLVFGEVIILMVTSLIVSSILLFKIKDDEAIRNTTAGFISIMSEFSVVTLSMTFLLLLVLSILICLLPLKNVENLQPKDLIGGID